MTIYILTVNILQWNEILTEHYGEPNDRGNTGNGKQYKTEDGVSLTVWEKPESKLSTMLISGNKHEYLNFYEVEIPKGFKEVTRASREIEAENEPTRK